MGLIQSVMVLELSRAMNCTRERDTLSLSLPLELTLYVCVCVYVCVMQRSRVRSSCWISTRTM